MKKVFLIINLILNIYIITISNAFASYCPQNIKITQEEIEKIQNKWGEGIVAIGHAPNYKEIAIEHINNLYSYDNEIVHFKPTKAAYNQFRKTKEEALSYFVGGIIPEDRGFALAPFTKVRFENSSISINCNHALAMGNYYFTTKNNPEELKVEYSFGYIKDDSGNIKINLHHSSLPFQNN